MEFRLEITDRAQADLAALSPAHRKRIITKLKYFIDSGVPFTFAKRLHNFESATHRFRIGDFRVLFRIDGATIFIQHVSDRKNSYQ